MANSGGAASKPTPKPGLRKAGRKKAAWEKWSASDWTAIEQALRSARPSEVTAAFGRIIPNFSQSEWLEKQHVLGGLVRAETGSAPHKASDALAIAEYVAASVPLHLADAWTYFGRAMGALATGTVEVAQHLLYYCELRAMHALLFRHGVVMLDRQAFVLRKSGTTDIPFPKDSRNFASNTHQGIWVLFKQWLQTPSAASFFGETVMLRSEPLAKWATERPLPSSVSAILGPLMEQWGMDLARFSRDRELRNQVSYNPNRLQLVPTGVTPSFIADLYQQVWMILEPGASNAFDALDRHIARDVFQAFSNLEPDDGAVTVPPQFSSMNEYWVHKVLGEDTGKFVTEFLDKPEEQPSPAIFVDAGRDLASDTLAKQFAGMVGRSLILLRFATGATRSLLSEAGCSGEQVEFWLDDMLALHGIRVPDSAPRDYLDLYDDIVDVVADLDLLASEHDPNGVAIITEMLAKEFQTLAGFERVPAWAVA